jgi:hypothetical protein
MKCAVILKHHACVQNATMFDVSSFLHPTVVSRKNPSEHTDTL